MARPWMPLYIADYRADTGHLTAAEHGAYLLLIMHYWVSGRLPDDDRMLARIACMTPAEWRRARPVVASFFDEGWRHKRIDRELTRAAGVVSSRSQAGKFGASVKWKRSGENKTRSQRLAEAREKGTHTAEEWRSLVHFHDGKCARCGSEQDIVKDHIIPIYKGGSDGIENLQPLCRSCNSSKGPDETDHRKVGWKRLANAWQTPGQPQPHPEEEDGGGGDAQAREPDRPAGDQALPPASLITPEAHALADELAAIAGVGAGPDTPPGWCGAAYRVQTWLSKGWSRDAILIGARAAMARKRDGPPFSVAFFEAPIAREIAAQAKPLPTVVDLPGATIHAGPSPGPQADRSVVSAARRLVDRLADLDRPADGGQPRPAVAGLLPPGRR